MQLSRMKELADVVSLIPFNRVLGLKIEQIEPGKVLLSFLMKPELVGNFIFGILHGGVISSVLDMAGGIAAMSSVLEKHATKSVDELKEIIGKSSTIDLNVNYLRPGQGKQFFAKAIVKRSGKRVCFTQVELHNEEDILIATGSATFLMDGS